MLKPDISLLFTALLAAAVGPSPADAGVLQGGPEPSQVRAVSLSGRLSNGGRPLSGAAVYLQSSSGVPDTPAMAPISIDQEHLRFVPGSVVVTPGTRVLFRNSDPVMHNIFSPGPDPFDLGTHARNQVVSHAFRTVGVHVMLCNIHPEMVAYVNVVPSPWSAVAGEDGAFSLPAVPAGEYILHVWVPRRGGQYSLPVRLDPAVPTSLDLVLTGGTLRVR